MTRILLAEDDDSLRNFLSRALERGGHRVVACPDGETALEALDFGLAEAQGDEDGDGTAFDMLLTDIVMPGIDGIEVARVAAQRHPGLRIMFITGFAAVALAANDRAPAGATVLSKPVHLRELVNEVERLIAA